MKVIGDWSLSSFVKTLLDIAYYGIAVTVVGVIAMTGLLIFSDLGNKGTLEVTVRITIDPQTINVNSASLGIQGAELRDIRANMRFPARPNMFLFGSFVGLMILLVFIMWVVAQLRLVFRSIRNGQPFLP